ncbi:MAG: alpha/beta fold hydrolase [Gammaproteobacteria bacterium]
MAFVDHQDGKIWYQVTGTGQPVALSGGFGLLHNQWDYVRDLLAKDFQVIDWNYRGAGLSDRSWPGGLYNQESWVDDLERVLDHLQLEDVVLWGTSTGSPLSIRYTAKYQHRVKALITYPMFKADAGFRQAFDGFRSIGEMFGYEALACLTSWIGCASENLFSAKQGELAKWEAACFEQNFSLETLAETMRIVATNDLSGDLPKITVPCHLLMGRSGNLGYDAPANRQLADEFQALVPHASLDVIDGGGGTYCMIETPASTARAVKNYIEQLS